MPVDHARFSPSSADRIIHCPGSLLLGEGIPETENHAMREGTEAHAWAEYELLSAYGEPPEDSPLKGEFFSEEMEYCARDYATYAMEKVRALKEECGDVQVLTEDSNDRSSPSGVDDIRDAPTDEPGEAGRSNDHP